MENLKRGSMILSLISGILEVVVSFIFYWLIYSIIKSNDIGDMSLPMVVLMCGLLGGVLAIVAACFVKSTKIVAPILILAAAVLLIFATLFLIIKSSTLSQISDATMIILPFFIVPNALCLTAGIMGLVAGCSKQ